MLCGPLGMAFTFSLFLAESSPDAYFTPWMASLTIATLEMLFFTYILICAYFKQFKLNPVLMTFVVGFVFYFQYGLGALATRRAASLSILLAFSALQPAHPICSNLYNGSNPAIVGTVCSRRMNLSSVVQASG